MSDLRLMIADLAHRFEAEDNAAHDLWSWLPSHKAAVKHHGDYASEHRPSAADIMREAAIVLSRAAGYPSELRDREWFACPCGEDDDDLPATAPGTGGSK